MFMNLNKIQMFREKKYDDYGFFCQICLISLGFNILKAHNSTDTTNW